MTDSHERIVFIPDHPGGLYAADPRRFDGAAIHIDDAPRGSSGLVCPECHRQLVARKGRIRSHHFAHKAEAGDRDAPICARAGETALHRLAKEIVEEAGGLSLPAYTVTTPEGTETFLKGGWQEFQEVHPEVAEEDMRPDLIATYRRADGKGSRLAIEFRVRHRVGEDKRARFAAMALSAVEIDLSVVDRALDRRALAAKILHGAPRAWLHNVRGQARQERLHDEAKARRREREAAEVEKKAEKHRARGSFEADNRDILRARKEARLARARGTNPTTRSWATAELARWSSIGRWPIPPGRRSDHMFEAERDVWMAAVMSVVAPWNDGVEHRTLAAAATAAAVTLRRRGYVKEGYAQEARGNPAQGEWAVDPVLAACEEVLTRIVMVDDHAGAAFSDLSSIRADWRFQQRRLELLREIADRAADYGARVHIGGWIVSTRITLEKAAALADSLDGSHRLSPSDLKQVSEALAPGHVRPAWSGPRDPFLSAAARLDLTLRREGEDITEEVLSPRSFRDDRPEASGKH